MAADRRALEARRNQAVGSLREVERRQAAGEIDEAEAAELIELFADRAAVATAELEAAGGRVPPASRERFLPAIVVAVLLALTALVVVVSQLSGKEDGDAPAAAIEAVPGQRDLDDVSNAEMEEVIAANPGVVPMRLALVERYLADGELRKAHDHAAEAVVRAGVGADRHRAEVYAAWTTALLGEPEEGARRLRAAVDEDPEDLNAKWFLANVLVDTGDRDGAAAVLREILGAEIPAAQRDVVEQKLESLGP